jgi:hypothetical protein
VAFSVMMVAFSSLVEFDLVFCIVLRAIRNAEVREISMKMRP